MGFKLLLGAVTTLFCCLVIAAHEHYHDYHNHHHSEEYYDSDSHSEEENLSEEDHGAYHRGGHREYHREYHGEDPKEAKEKEYHHVANPELWNSRKDVSPEKEEGNIVMLLPSYEVTENVIDIPNNDTYRGPVIANFPLARPLNNASFIITNDSNNFPNINTNTGNNKLRRNYLSILHVKAEYDDPNTNIPSININKYTFPNIREYIQGVRTGMANGINSFVNKQIHSGVNKGIFVPNVVAAPILFLHRKGSEAATKVHNAIFGNRLDDD